MSHRPLLRVRPLAPPEDRDRARMGVRMLLAVVVVSALGSVLAVGCSDGGDADTAEPNDTAEPDDTAEPNDKVVRCELGVALDAVAPDGSGDRPIRLGTVDVAGIVDAERVVVGSSVAISFDVVVQPALDRDGAGQVVGADIAIVQVRSTGGERVRFTADRSDAAGSEEPGPVAVLSFERCGQPVSHRVTIESGVPGCVAVVGGDAASGGFVELPVRLGVESCPDV